MPIISENQEESLKLTYKKWAESPLFYFVIIWVMEMVECWYVIKLTAGAFLQLLFPLKISIHYGVCRFWMPHYNSFFFPFKMREKKSFRSYYNIFVTLYDLDKGESWVELILPKKKLTSKIHIWTFYLIVLYCWGCLPIKYSKCHLPLSIHIFLSFYPLSFYLSQALPQKTTQRQNITLVKPLSDTFLARKGSPCQILES